MELFDISTRLEVGKLGIPQAPDLSGFISLEDILANVYPSVITFLKDEKYATIFGVVHALSIGRICAMGDHFSNFGVFQIDAHDDLRSEYQGSICNTAFAVMKPAKNIIGFYIAELGPHRLHKASAFLAAKLYATRYEAKSFEENKIHGFHHSLWYLFCSCAQ